MQKSRKKVDQKFQQLSFLINFFFHEEEEVLVNTLAKIGNCLLQR